MLIAYALELLTAHERPAADCEAPLHGALVQVNLALEAYCRELAEDSAVAVDSVLFDSGANDFRIQELQGLVSKGGWLGELLHYARSARLLESPSSANESVELIASDVAGRESRAFDANSLPLWNTVEPDHLVKLLTELQSTIERQRSLARED